MSLTAGRAFTLASQQNVSGTRRELVGCLRSLVMTGPLWTGDEQLAYYRAVADEYEDHAIDAPGQDELLSAIESFRPTGRVLELMRVGRVDRQASTMGRKRDGG